MGQGFKFERGAVPSAEQVMSLAGTVAREQIKGVSEEMVGFFKESAQELLAEETSQACWVGFGLASACFFFCCCSFASFWSFGVASRRFAVVLVCFVLSWFALPGAGCVGLELIERPREVRRCFPSRGAFLYRLEPMPVGTGSPHGVLRATYSGVL